MDFLYQYHLIYEKCGNINSIKLGSYQFLKRLANSFLKKNKS